jgi:hypothetical protein
MCSAQAKAHNDFPEVRTMSTIAQELNVRIEAYRLTHGSRPIMVGLGRRELEALRQTHPHSVASHNYGGISIEERSEDSIVHFYAGRWF